MTVATTFPTKIAGLSLGESPSKYDIKNEVADIRADAEGGYEARRPRFTRRGRDQVTTGFIGLTQADFNMLNQFWLDHTTTVAFIYHDYMVGIDRQVRFEKEPDWNPSAIGTTRRWSPTFQMKEV